jgi:hypothetical protein
MDIKEFLDLSIGKWFVQRTNYHLTQTQADNSKADITIEMLSPDDPQVIQLCQQNNIDPNLSLGGTKHSWDNSVDWGKSKQQGSSLIVLIPDSDNSAIGRLLRKTEHQEEVSISGRYILGKDLALTLIIETENFYAEERQWFASNNLKLRTTIVKAPNGSTQTYFYSEIRKAAPPKESSAS